jgi:hypothetical protein
MKCAGGRGIARATVSTKDVINGQTLQSRTFRNITTWESPAIWDMENGQRSSNKSLNFMILYIHYNEGL